MVPQTGLLLYVELATLPHRSMLMQATVAILDRKMAILRAEISEQAALAAQRHKFNQGSLQPTGDTSPGRLASGLAATAHVRHPHQDFSHFT